ncbi:glycosyltransferase family 2 protein [Engelhardtia mirabilis]|uniref:Poly-beta-1,6-N-acetyl-D-glucosamine synthase n=1 Tax=Engelhardtia mirabilis TaxID=2528011 RepID=A0A518BJE5_9BACT|nr:Poly-beta-1,6-N-acetyl-D-glucosamine synthase [Planctomycetes bacterium Pla133]QDV01402.1 Poly-beta-1,6-N-acetyl-D-glucosamine synthase [Planctomycetes bacterium Pla86]
MPAPLVSIVLPTLNGRADLERLLPRLAEQELEGGFELLAVDSSSSDGSVELLEQAGADVRRIRREDFSHGGTRTERAADAKGEFLVFLSQDALPSDSHFLARLIEPFADPRVAGAYARVLPNPGDDLLTARTVLDLPEASPEPGVRDLDQVAGLWELPPIQRVAHIRFNNVASAIRRSAFAEIPFPTIDFGEDVAWAARALTSGWRLAYAPAAVAYHAHRYSARKAFARYRQDARFHRAAHDWAMRPTLGSAARGWCFELASDLREVRRAGVLRHLGDLLRAPVLRGAQILGQYVGSRGTGGRLRPPMPITIPPGPTAAEDLRA